MCFCGFHFKHPSNLLKSLPVCNSFYEKAEYNHEKSLENLGLLKNQINEKEMSKLIIDWLIGSRSRVIENLG